jgi:hypothetical protein
LEQYGASVLDAGNRRLLCDRGQQDGTRCRHDVTLAAQVVDTKGYSPSEILFGVRYADVFSFDAQGHPVADLSAVRRMERDVGAEPVLSGWDGRHWNEGEP